MIATIRHSWLQVAAIVSLALCAAGSVLNAQSNTGAQRATRTELSATITQLEQQLANGQLKGDRQKNARRDIEAIRVRLTQGDFKVGDRFVLILRQDVVRSDTASVRDSLIVSVAGLPDVSLAGTLRSELDDRLTTHVSRYLKNASVRTVILTRIVVLGAVRSPGYYYAPPDRPVSDLVMLAGGPAVNAKVREFELSRGSSVLLKGKNSERAVESGMTLEQLDIQSGDEVRIPVARRINWGVVTRGILVLSSLFFGILQFLQWYYNRQDA